MAKHKNLTLNTLLLIKAQLNKKAVNGVRFDYVSIPKKGKGVYSKKVK